MRNGMKNPKRGDDDDESQAINESQYNIDETNESFTERKH